MRPDRRKEYRWYALMPSGILLIARFASGRDKLASVGGQAGREEPVSHAGNRFHLGMWVSVGYP